MNKFRIMNTYFKSNLEDVPDKQDREKFICDQILKKYKVGIQIPLHSIVVWDFCITYLEFKVRIMWNKDILFNRLYTLDEYFEYRNIVLYDLLKKHRYI